MIDIDASLVSIESKQTFWVRFSDPGSEGDNLAFECKAAPRKQRQLIDRSVKLSTTFRQETDDSGNVQISSDWIGLSSALLDYIVGWEGFTGEFNREKVKKWFDAYPSYAIAFAQSFRGILDEYEKNLIKRKDSEAKN